MTNWFRIRYINYRHGHPWNQFILVEEKVDSCCTPPGCSSRNPCHSHSYPSLSLDIRSPFQYFFSKKQIIPDICVFYSLSILGDWRFTKPINQCQKYHMLTRSSTGTLRATSWWCTAGVYFHINTYILYVHVHARYLVKKNHWVVFLKTFLSCLYVLTLDQDYYCYIIIICWHIIILLSIFRVRGIQSWTKNLKQSRKNHPLLKLVCLYVNSTFGHLAIR